MPSACSIFRGMPRQLWTAAVLASALLVGSAFATQQLSCATADESWLVGGYLTVSCPSAAWYISSVGYAVYGTSRGSCGSFRLDPYRPCGTDVTWYAAPRCLHASSCSLPVDNGVYGDPCPGIFKLLVVQVTCTICDPATGTTGIDYWGNKRQSGWTMYADWTCSPGYVTSRGYPYTRSCNMDVGTWSAPAIDCYSCGSLYYCPGNNQRYLCPAGTYAKLTDVNLATSLCSGSCAQGYFCPAGSSSPTQQVCGSAAVYCPAGTSSILTVPAGSYSGPLTVDPTIRYQSLPCPTYRQCSNGVINPGVQWGTNAMCGTVPATATVMQAQTNAAVFTTTVTTPGYAGSMVWTLTGITPASASCTATTSMFTWTTDASGTTGTLNIGNTAVDYTACFQGFDLAFRVARSNDATLFLTCTIAVIVTQQVRAPTITDCAGRNVFEKQPMGALVGSPLTGSNPNTGTSLRWAITTNPNFIIDTCTGQIQTKQPLSYLGMQPTPYNDLTVTLTNDGSALGFTSVSVTCSIRLTVKQLILPPIIVTTTMYTRDLQAVGTVVTPALNVSDPNGAAITNYRWSQTDPTDPTAFVVNAATGVVTNAKVLDTLISLQSSYSYMLTVTDALGATGSAPINILVAQIPRPPITFPQLRSISEAAAGGTTLAPALAATSPQGFTLTFIISPTTLFGVVASTGMLYLQPSATLDYQVATNYTLSLTILDSAGSSVSTIVTVLVTEVNKPPFFAAPNSEGRYNMSITYGAGSGSPLTGGAMPVLDVNRGQTLTYRAVSWSPPTGAQFFVLDAVAGTITLPLGGMPTGSTLGFEWGAAFPLPRTYVLQFTVTDSANLPPQAYSIAGTANIEVRSIPPRITALGPYTILGNSSTGTVVGTVSAQSAYAASGLSFAITRNAATPAGDVPFAINPTTGVISIVGTPRWDYNAQPMLTIQVTVNDTGPTAFLNAAGTGPAAATATTSNVTIMLQHTNRAPFFTCGVQCAAAAATAGTICSPVSTCVYDADLPLPVGEALTYTILGGNTENTFAIDAASGQVYVANESTVAFRYDLGPRFFNLTVGAADSGVDGPRYAARGWVYVNITNANKKPTVPYVRLFIDEHSGVGTVVGSLAAVPFDITTDVQYSLVPRASNVNQPFPFNITAFRGAGSPYNQGRIAVSAGQGPIDWNQLFKVYNCTVTVCDNHPVFPLCASNDLDIVVRWVAQPPFFVTDPSASIVPGVQPANPPLAMYSQEHRVAGSFVGNISATSKDPWQRPALTFAWGAATPLAVRQKFTLTTARGVGVVTLSALAGDLALVAQPSYTLSVIVTDSNALTATTSLAIMLVDVPEPAVFDYLVDAVTNRTVSVASVPENATVGTPVAWVKVHDDDAVTSPLMPWGSTAFAIVPDSSDAAYFSIDVATGLLLVAHALDYWDQTRFMLNVSVADGVSFTYNTTYVRVVVNVTQVNTVRIAGFYVDGSLAAAVARNVSATQVVFTTRGVPTPLVFVVGGGFGRTARRLAAEGLTPAATRVTAVFGGGYTATCAVFIPNTVLACSVPPGFGTGHSWTIIIDSAWSASTPAGVTTGYLAPAITGVWKRGVAAGAAAAAHQITTRGTDRLLVNASDIGPVGTPVYIAYGRTSVGSATGLQAVPAGIYSIATFGALAPCTWVTDQTTVDCPTTPAVGSSLRFALRVGGQASPEFTNTSVRYATPLVTSVTAPVLSTAGGQIRSIVLNGSDFGPATTPLADVSVALSRDFADTFYTVFTAANCFVSPSSPHATVICDSVAGVGANLAVRVTVGAQTSASSADTVAYATPIVTALSGEGKTKALTIGGQEIVLTGRSFGPVTPLFANGSVIPADLQPIAVYGRNGTATYQAANCRVVVQDTTISCATVEGVGRDLLWSVTTGGPLGARSAPYTAEGSSYHPPIVASFGGPGAENAVTWGQQTVILNGTNMGPANTTIEAAFYGADEEMSTFESPSCTMVTPHTAIACQTAVGAGAGLKWSVIIGGQRSVSPTTAYGVPVIYNFTGTGSVNGSTDGSTGSLTIHGDFFSVDRWLDYVTYGRSGYGFTAFDCFLSVNHTSIACSVPPGAGRALSVVVSVGGQVSRASTETISYAVPHIDSATPWNATTDARGADGKALAVRLVGTDFALAYASNNLVVKINNRGVPRPPQADLDAHWTDLYDGGPGLPAVAAYVSALSTLYATSKNMLGAPSAHAVSFTLPEGFGQQVDLFVSVAGVPSNIVPFTYASPVIRNVAPDRQNVSIGFLRVFIEGSSFCDGLNDCGTVYINNVSYAPITWSHGSILVIAPDPATTEGSAAEVVVEVAGVRSNVFRFFRPVPNINALAAQGMWTTMDTRGNEWFFIAGVMDITGINDTVSITIGGRPCTDQWGFVDNGLDPTDRSASFSLYCRTPPGVGQNLPILLVYQNMTSRDNAGFRFAYAPPQISAVSLVVPFYDADTAAAAMAGTLPLPPLESAALLSQSNPVPTLGAVVVIDGDDFGEPALGGSPVLLDPLGRTVMHVVHHNHTRLIAVVPPGDGVVHAFQFTVGTQSSNLAPFLHAAPTITALEPNHGRALGGTIVRVVGRDFGITQPAITLGGRNCTILQPFNVSINHSEVFCVSPVGQGRDLPSVMITSMQSSSMPTALWHYDAPMVDSVTPSSAPTSGLAPGPFLADGIHRADGPRITAVVRGRNFAASGMLSFLPGPQSDALSPNNVTVPVHDIISWNDSTIVFLVPAGYGQMLYTTVWADQAPAQTQFWSYDSPEVHTIIRADRPASACNAIEQCFTFGNDTRCRPVPAGCYDTRGSYLLEIIGASFGPQASLRAFTSVFLGDKACSIPRDAATGAGLSHTRIVCTAPAGLGVNLPVAVSVGTRISAPSNGSVFSYDPPIVSSMSPNEINANLTQLSATLGLTIRGKNFGLTETPLAIDINDEPCIVSTWLNDGVLNCRTPPQVVGSKNVSILVANRTQPTEFFDVEQMLVYVCAPQYYGVEGEVCLACPQGATCPGAERLEDLVNSTAGYWRMNVASDSDDAGMFCDQPRRVTRDHCPIFMPCGPSEACLAGNICAEGYEGERCSQCLKGKYHRVDDLCVRCPSSMPLLYAGLAVIFLLFFAFGWFLNSRNINIAVLAIGIDYAQVMSMFARTKIRWPAMLRQLFQVLSAFNLNLEIAAPECLNPEIQFWQKWFFIESIPIVVAAFCGLVFAARYLYKTAFLNVNKKQRSDHLPPLVATSIIIMRVLFLYLTRTSFDVLNCTPTDPPVFRDQVNKKNTIEYMNGMVDPSFECWAPHSWQLFLFPFGVGTLVSYTFALPLAVLWVLRKNPEKIKTDQILRCRGLGNDRLTHPYYDFRVTWQKLYQHYLPGKWYWEYCIIARKIFIAGTALAFRQVPSYQLAIALLVLFTAYVLHVLHWPYLSHAAKPRVLEEHARKCAIDALHAQIETQMRELLKRNVRKRERSNVFATRQVDDKSMASVLLLSIFDPNSVEAFLLGCCVLVSLAGIMLDSKRFDGDSWYIPQVQREYTGLTFGCLMIIIGSLLFYGLVVFLELCLVFCPDAVPALLGLCCRRKMAANKLATGKKGERRYSSRFEGDQTSDLAVNPMLLKQQESAFGSMRLLGEVGILDAKQLRLIEQPNGHMWRTTLDSYEKVIDMMLSFREEVRGAKNAAERQRDAEESAKAREAGPATSRSKTRRQFQPTARSDDDPLVGAAGSGGAAGTSRGGGTSITSNPLARRDSASSLSLMPFRASRPTALRVGSAGRMATRRTVDLEDSDEEASAGASGGGGGGSHAVPLASKAESAAE